MLNSPEPPPKPNAGTPIWELVVADMKQRDADGRAKYGTPLQAFNGRKALVDGYQEALDLVVYVRQEIEERRAQFEAYFGSTIDAVKVGMEMLDAHAHEHPDEKLGKYDPACHRCCFVAFGLAVVLRTR